MCSVRLYGNIGGGLVGILDGESVVTYRTSMLGLAVSTISVVGSVCAGS